MESYSSLVYMIFLTGCGIFEIWVVWDVEYSRCGMFGIWDVCDVSCLGCEMFEMWDVWYWMIVGMWGVGLQNTYPTNKLKVCFESIPENKNTMAI